MRHSVAICCLGTVYFCHIRTLRRSIHIELDSIRYWLFWMLLGMLFLLLRIRHWETWSAFTQSIVFPTAFTELDRIPAADTLQYMSTTKL